MTPRRRVVCTLLCTFWVIFWSFRFATGSVHGVPMTAFAAISLSAGVVGLVAAIQRREG